MKDINYSKTEKSIPKISFSKIFNELKEISKHSDRLSKVVDYSLQEIMPKIYGENIEKAYELSKKQIDYVMRHLL